MPQTSDHIPFIGAVKDDWKMFSDDPDDYVIGSPIGFGASSIVHAATFRPKDGSPSIPCALKVVDLDKMPQQSLRLLRRETQLMSLSKHPNVLRVRGSWMQGHKLYIALRLMNSGSAADVIRYGWPGGMEEEVVKCILKQALEGLSYLHVNGFIHRDIKAANLLIDDDGTVLLGDLGVAASLSDEEAIPAPSGSKTAANVVAGVDRTRPSQTQHGHRMGKRKSFVGTPCWMAPELILGKQYDSKADIWSFGITAIELCQGRAPRSREAPSKVLMKTVQESPPSFDRQGGQYKYSKAFKEMVESCLVKDPAQRPTAADLLDSPFFKSAKKKSYLVGAILKDLPPLVSRLERRRQPSPRSSVFSFESWDFTTSPVSPSPSVFPRTHSLTPSLSALPEDGRTSHALSRFHKSIYEGVVEIRKAHSDSSQEDSISEDDSAEASASPSASSTSSNPTTPELGNTPLPSESSTPLSCSPADIGTVKPGQWLEYTNGKYDKPATSKASSTSDKGSKPTAEPYRYERSTSKPVGLRIDTAVNGSEVPARKSVWHKLLKVKNSDDEKTSTVKSTRHQRSFVGRIFETVNAEPGKRRGSFGSTK